MNIEEALRSSADALKQATEEVVPPDLERLSHRRLARSTVIGAVGFSALLLAVVLVSNPGPRVLTVLDEEIPELIGAQLDTHGVVIGYSVVGPSLAVLGETVFVIGGPMSDQVVALGEAGTRLSWRTQLSPPLPSGPAGFVYVDEDILVIADHGTFWAVDPTSGAEVWRVNLTEEDWPSAVAGAAECVGPGCPAVWVRPLPGKRHQDLILLPVNRAWEGDSEPPEVLALGIEEGDLRWRTRLVSEHPEPSLAPGDASYTLVDGQLTLVVNGTVQVFDAETGHSLRTWAFDVPSGFLPRQHVLAHNGVAYVSLTDQSLVALDIGSGRELWRMNASGSGISPIAEANDLLLIINGSSVAGVHPTTGAVVWNSQVGEELSASLHGSDLLVAHRQGATRLNAATGSPIWQIRKPMTPRTFGLEEPFPVIPVTDNLIGIVENRRLQLVDFNQGSMTGSISLATASEYPTAAGNNVLVPSGGELEGFINAYQLTTSGD